jgi:hypothetical protein
MSASPVDIFLAAADVESFRRAITALDGDFDFDRAAMIAFGTAYFQKYPDREHDRKMEEVRLGYELVRICAIEKMVRGLPADRKEVYRTALSRPASAGPAAEGLAGSIGPEGLAADIALLGAALEDIKRSIDEIPKGMIRERFAGGVSSLFNLLYVFKMKARPRTP